MLDLFLILLSSLAMVVISSFFSKDPKLVYVCGWLGCSALDLIFMPDSMEGFPDAKPVLDLMATFKEVDTFLVAHYYTRLLNYFNSHLISIFESQLSKEENQRKIDKNQEIRTIRIGPKFGHFRESSKLIVSLFLRLFAAC